MSSERISDEKAADIENALKEHSRFLAYVRVNALLHDCDKATSEFLLWSLVENLTKDIKAERPTPDKYERHNLPTKDPRRSSELRSEYVNHWKEHVAKTKKDFDPDEYIPFPTPYYFLSYSYSYEIKEKKKKITVRKNSVAKNKTREGCSLYDFAIYHHDPTYLLEEDAPTALLLFTSGSGGIDGKDTGYETEMQSVKERGYHGHHSPDTTLKNTVLISTPFGFERPVDIKSAEQKLTGIKEKLKKLVAALQDDTHPMEATAELEKNLEPPFRESIIRTGRPVNDVTLADHAISTASLVVAQAARVVLETLAPPDRTASYCLPARRRTKDSPSQQTGFAAFSCAVNADKLDQMALELKDITAIRKETEKLLKRFLTLFSEEYPVGGTVYRDQHGAHLVVPILGNSAKRWVKGTEEKLIRIDKPDEQESPEWEDSPLGALTNEEFVQWLFATAKRELQALAFKDDPNEKVHLGAELLIGLRYNPIMKKLNRLAYAIDWSRKISWLSVAAPRDLRKGEGGGCITFFNFLNPPEKKNIDHDLCGVCGIRIGTNRKHRKCDLCEQRSELRRVLNNETGDIEKLAGDSVDHRIVLLTVSFDLSNWLSATSNTGIFCHESNKPGEWPNQKTTGYQRFNSFGRFRRIWRSTEIFLKELRNQIREICGHSNKENNPYLMRTILLAPQDVQIILPAAKAGKALDAVYKKFTEEFGRVSDRMPFHVSLCIFPFRVPIYLVLEAARRLRDSCLQTKPKQAELHKIDLEDEKSNLLRTDIRQDKKGQQRCYSYPLFRSTWRQKYQPPDLNIINGNDQFHANICIERDNQERPTKWMFVGDAAQEGKAQTAWMTDNRLAIVEISSGFSLDELARPSEKLNPSRCHDIPLGYWPCLKELIRLENDNISETQQRRLRSVLAMREKLWHEDDLPGDKERPEEQEEFLRDSIQTLWRDPSRFGPKKWDSLKDDDKKLLEESCLNGTIFLASVVKKYLQNNDDKEQDHV